MTPTLPAEIRQPTVTELAALFNDYVQYSDNANLIMKTLYYGLSEPGNPFSIANTCTLLEGITAPRVLSSLSSTEVLQPSDSNNFNSKGNLTFTGNILSPQGWKIDTTFNDQETWFAAKQALSAMQMGLIPTEVNRLSLHVFMVEELLSRSVNDLRKIIFTGEKAATTDATAVLDGFNKIFADAVTAGKLSPLGILATSASNVLEKITTLVNAAGIKWRYQPTFYVAVAPNVYNMITQVASGLGSTQPVIVINNGNREQIANNIMGIPLPTMPNVKIYQEPYLPTDGMYATVKENMVVGFDTMNTGRQLRAESVARLVNIMGDGMVGVQVRQFDAPNGYTDETAFVCNEACAGA